MIGDLVMITAGSFLAGLLAGILIAVWTLLDGEKVL